MRVPETVKVLFDTFPLITLPKHEAANIRIHSAATVNEPVLAVYSIDASGLPLDPKCLAMAGLLILADVRARYKTASPYISSAETLPLLMDGGGPRSAVTTIDHVLNAHFAEQASDPTFKIYRALIDTWLDDAWHAAIMEPDYATEKIAIYGRDEYTMPWPFNTMARAQLDTHLETRYNKARVASGDDYLCSFSNLKRVKLAIKALEEAVTVPLRDKPTALDILVFAYTWPILSHLRESALAAIITPNLEAHAKAVHAFLLNHLLTST